MDFVWTHCTEKSILGITQIINKAYLVTKFNQNNIILICTISLSDLFTKPKRPGVCIRSNSLNAQCSTLRVGSHVDFVWTHCTEKSILGITQIINKAYLVTKFNQNNIILICTISLSDLFTKPKRPGVCIRSNSLNSQYSTLRVGSHVFFVGYTVRKNVRLLVHNDI